jgi:predicted PurR-regulated permease PerM
MSGIVNIGLSISILIIFFIVIGIGYVYIDEGRHNIETMNSTITKFIDSWNHKQTVDNIRFNQTLNGLANTYHLIVENQHLILNSSNQTNTLVKFLSDNFGEHSDYIDRENFQYQQANETFRMIKEIRNNLSSQ